MIEITLPGDGRILYAGYSPFRKRPVLGFREGTVFRSIASVDPEELEGLVDWLTKLAERGPHRNIWPEA